MWSVQIVASKNDPSNATMNKIQNQSTETNADFSKLSFQIPNNTKTIDIFKNKILGKNELMIN